MILGQGLALRGLLQLPLEEEVLLWLKQKHPHHLQSSSYLDLKFLRDAKKQLVYILIVKHLTQVLKLSAMHNSSGMLTIIEEMPYCLY